MSSVLVSNCSSTCAIERIFSRSSLVRIGDRKSTRLNSSHSQISYAVFCLKKKKQLQHLGRRALVYLLLVGGSPSPPRGVYGVSHSAFRAREAMVGESMRAPLASPMHRAAD